MELTYERYDEWKVCSFCYQNTTHGFVWNGKFFCDKKCINLELQNIEYLKKKGGGG